MAIVSVTTDEGELIERITDEGEDIGNLDKPMARSVFMDTIARGVKMARQKDRRKPDGTE